MLTVKYIDPSYMVRAVAADNLCCTLLAHSAIDGAMAGYTGFVPGLINGNYGYIPVVEVAEARNPVDTSGLGSGPSRLTNHPDFVQGTQMPLRIARKCPGRAHTSVL
jgi:6-phosphofructokinase 1